MRGAWVRRWACAWLTAANTAVSSNFHFRFFSFSTKPHVNVHVTHRWCVSRRLVPRCSLRCPPALLTGYVAAAPELVNVAGRGAFKTTGTCSSQRGHAPHRGSGCGQVSHLLKEQHTLNGWVMNTTKNCPDYWWLITDQTAPLVWSVINHHQGHVFVYQHVKKQQQKNKLKS